MGRKVVFSVLACLLPALLVFGAAAGAQTTVRVATYSLPRFELMRDHLLPVWQEKYPDIQVELELHTSTADQLSKVMLTMATDVAPDVIDTAGTLLFSYVVNNGVVDVAPYLERDGLTDEWFPHTLDEVRYPFETGTGLYGLPYDWVGGVLVYNTDLFDQTGMVYPDPTWTWEDVRIAARRLTQDTDGDGVPDVWGFHVQEPGNVPFDPVVRAHGGSILTPDRKAAAINSPAAAQVLELFYGMVNEDRSTGFRQGANLFALGRVAMEVVGSWTIRNVDNQGTNYGVTTVPAGPAGRSAYGGSNVWAVIKRPGQDMEAVWTIVKELVSYDTLRLISNEYGLPARRALIPDWELTKVNQALMESTPYMFHGEWTPDWSTWQIAKRAELDPAVQGARPIPEALERAEAAINRVLAEAYPQ